ncbi:unnamed protein product [Rotaria sordida]|uniref:Uncharacterized protein n=1 Tax=Rotaria sordida TaxID=392033 RepID=A0A814QP53_9BILA|nr:unnamed protein product [Rotaria sordida]
MSIFLADIANIEQTSLCLRYVHNGLIQEKFIKFIHVQDRSGAGLANVLLREVTDLVRTELLTEHAKALNLKQQDLQNKINDQTAPDEHIALKKLKTKLANVCITRWVERHTSVDTFYSLYPAIIETLEELIHINEKEVSAKANIFTNSLLTSDFLCTLPALNKLLTFTVNIPRTLQSNKIDLLECLDAIEDVIQVLQMIRNDPDQEYQYVFEEATDLAKYTGTTIKMPRVVSKQQNRNNIPAVNEYEYYKSNLFIPLLDHFLMSLKTRFSVHVKHAATISCIIPKFIHEKVFNDLIPAVELYKSLLPGSLAEIRAEFLQWKNKWINLCNENKATTNSLNNNTSLKRKLITIPDTAIESFNECNEAFFPNIKALLKIFSSLPVIYGSALQAGFLSGAKRTRDILLLDVNPLSISYEIPSGEKRTIIPFLESEISIPRNNHILGKFDLTNIQCAKQGVSTIGITLFINVNGILTITADERGTTGYNNIKIVSYTPSLSQDKIICMIKRFEKFTSQDKTIKECVNAKNQLKSYIYLLKTLLNSKEKFCEKVSDGNKR